ncbi:hypothetical protein KFU94_44150 [Chloroflexi bacterium TSY]|nr:hypothetical protein [Chloroflexi bacterium TSY]
MTRLDYDKAFFRIQLIFAYKVAEITGEPFNEIIIDHTQLRNIYGLYVPRTNPSDPLWQAFMHGLVSCNDLEEETGWAYDFYHTHYDPGRYIENNGVYWGCFYYAYPYHDRPAVRLHFIHRDTAGKGVFSKERMGVRIAELTDMFQHIKATHPEAETVIGGSWLYNIEAYRRLFPTRFLVTAQPGQAEPGFWSTWGQFLRRNGRLDEAKAEAFQNCLKQQTTLEVCLSCFPFKTLRLHCPIDVFYEHYKIYTAIAHR